MSSPVVFEVNGQEFFRPHVGKQLALLQQLTSRVRWGVGPSKVFVRGNRGSGKSVILRKGLLHALAMAVPGLRYGVIRRNMPDLTTNHLIYLQHEMTQLGGDYVGSPFPMCRYENGSLGFYRQCEDEADVEKIVGAELGVLLVDEAPQIQWDLLRTISPSIRVAKLRDGTVPFHTLEIYSGNPIGESIDELDHYCFDRDVTPADDPEYDPADWGCIETSSYILSFGQGMRLNATVYNHTHNRKFGRIWR